MACAIPSADDMDWHRLHHRAGRCQSEEMGGGRAAKDVYSVRSGDGIVYLDLADDSYSCEYSALANSDEAVSRDDYAGGVRATAAPASPTPPDMVPETLLSLVDILYFMRAMGSVLLRFPGRPLVALINRAVKTAPRRERQKIDQASAHAAKFRRMCLFLPFRPACLLGCYAMLEYLHLRGTGADWAFGVQLFPFRAHCWLAADAHILTDRPDNIAFYRPILVVPGSRS